MNGITKILCFVVAITWNVFAVATVLPEPVELTPSDFGLDTPRQAESSRAARLQRGFAPQVTIPARFTCKSSVEVQGSAIELGAVASCSGDPAICEEAYAIELGSAPDPGKQVSLTRAQITAILRAEWPNSAIEVDGASVVRVKAAFDDLETDSVASRLREALTELEQAHPNFRFTIEQVLVPKNERLRPGQCRVEFPTLVRLPERSPDWLIKHLVGHLRLEAKCLYEDKKTLSHPFIVTAKLALERLLPVARLDLSRGHNIREEDFEPAWVGVSRDHAHAVDEIAAARGRRLTRQVAVGSPVLWSQLELPLAIRRGQIVRLSLQRGALGITGPVKAMANGGYGQMIDAIYLPTKKILKVRVKDTETVEYVAHD